MAGRISFVLALPAAGTFEAHRRRRDGPSRKRKASAIGMYQEGHTLTIIVQAGEDIEEVILSNLHHNMPLHLEGRACNSIILTASGDVFRPLLVVSGDPVFIPSDEESFSIINLQGTFSVDREGSSRTIGLTISCADSSNHMFGGSISGPLIAAGLTQVTLFLHTNGVGDEQEAVSGHLE